MSDLIRKTINVPPEMAAAISTIQAEYGLKSWSQAAVLLLVRQLEQESIDRDETVKGWWNYQTEADKIEAWQDQRRAKGESTDPVLYYLEHHLNWGGSRWIQMKCGWCGHIQNVQSAEDECKQCGECEFVAIK